jgi:MraZ protein
VARRFRGEFHQKVDAKGRVSIPAQFRRVLESGDPDFASGKSPEFVIVYGDHRRKYLECYTIEAIDEVDERISDMPRGSVERNMLETLFSGQSLQTGVDDTGRIVLTKKLREKIGIADEAFFIAKGDTFQIWKPETYEREEVARTEAWLDQLPEDFNPITLLDKNREA